MSLSVRFLCSVHRFQSLIAPFPLFTSHGRSLLSASLLYAVATCFICSVTLRLNQGATTQPLASVSAVAIPAIGTPYSGRLRRSIISQGYSVSRVNPRYLATMASLRPRSSFYAPALVPLLGCRNPATRSAIKTFLQIGINSGFNASLGGLKRNFTNRK